MDGPLESNSALDLLPDTADLPWGWCQCRIVRPRRRATNLPYRQVFEQWPPSRKNGITPENQIGELQRRFADEL